MPVIKVGDLNSSTTSENKFSIAIPNRINKQIFIPKWAVAATQKGNVSAVFTNNDASDQTDNRPKLRLTVSQLIEKSEQKSTTENKEPIKKLATIKETLAIQTDKQMTMPSTSELVTLKTKSIKEAIVLEPDKPIVLAPSSGPTALKARTIKETILLESNKPIMLASTSETEGVTAIKETFTMQPGKPLISASLSQSSKLSLLNILKNEKIITCKLCRVNFRFDMDMGTNRDLIERHFFLYHNINVNNLTPEFLSKLNHTLKQCSDLNKNREVLFSNEYFTIKQIAVSDSAKKINSVVSNPENPVPVNISARPRTIREFENLNQGNPNAIIPSKINQILERAR